MRVHFFLMFAMLCPAGALAAPARGVYSDSLLDGFESWSWSVNLNFGATTPVHSGTKSISVTYTSGYGGLRLQTYSSVSATDYTKLRFWIHGGASGGQSIKLFCYDPGGNSSAWIVLTKPTANTWTYVEVPLTTFNIPQIAGVCWQSNIGSVQTTYYLDDIDFEAVPTVAPPPPALTVDAAAGRYPINPLIYGMNWVDPALATDLRVPLSRWGGDSTTRYNWQQDASNHAADWYFMSFPEDNAHPELLPNGSSSDVFVENNRSIGIDSFMCIPMVGWVAKDRVVRWSYSIAKYGAQQDHEYWHPDAGNGVRTDGSLITTNDKTDANVQVGPDFVQAWIQHLVSKYGSAAAGGVKYYNYDNEPTLYRSTHRDVHPQPITADELLNLCTTYGPAVKAADPAASMLGPTAGWNEVATGKTLPGITGDPPLNAWIIYQLQQYEQTYGQRLLDYLDVHYYPGYIYTTTGDAWLQDLRLRATRALWDPTYIEEDWVSKAPWLIPRLHQWVDTYYPGRKVSLGEYNFGGWDSINGALAQADILGILARERMDLATLWGPPASTDPQAYAWRMFRNYDGAGGGFGMLYVNSTSTDQSVVSVYGSIQRDSSLAVMLISKAAFDLTCNLTLANFAPRGAAQVYRYSPADLTRIVRQADLPVSGPVVAVALPASSITLLVVPAQLGGDLDGNGVVDQADVALFVGCTSGPGIPLANPSVCGPADFDGDGDVDQEDFGALQRCLSDPNSPQDPACASLLGPA